MVMATNRELAIKNYECNNEINEQQLSQSKSCLYMQHWGWDVPQVSAGTVAYSTVVTSNVNILMNSVLNTLANFTKHDHV